MIYEFIWTEKIEKLAQIVRGVKAFWSKTEKEHYDYIHAQKIYNKTGDKIAFIAKLQC